MKRASDVPPVVESFGVDAGHLGDRLADHRRRTGRASVRNTSEFDGSQSMLPADRCCRRPSRRGARLQRRSSARVRVSLKRMLKRARASAGIRLTVLLPTSIEVNSRFDGPKCSVPLSSGSALIAPISVDDAAHRIVGEFRIGDVALRAGDDQRAVLRAAPADLDHVAERLRIGRLAQNGSDRISRRARPPIAAA